MKTLLIPLGSMGDIHPFIGLGLRLRSRGHDVTVISDMYYASLARNHGLAFHGLKSIGDLATFFQDPDLCHPIRGWIASGKRFAVQAMREIYQTIAENYVPGETVVAAPYGAFGARLAQEKLGVPLATIVPCPHELRSLYHSPVLPRPMVLDDWVPRISKRFQFWIMDRFFADPVVAPATNAFRRELGLRPIRRLLAGWCFSPDRIIGLFPDWYAPPQPDWPAQTVLTGFPRWDPAINNPSHHEALAFARAGTPPIVFIAGSYNRHAKPFHEAAVECCVSLGRRGILLTKWREHLPAQLPSSIRHFDFVPLATVLPHAAALVSHGGIGTVAQGLAAGVPQVLMPLNFNQPDDAVRLKQFEVADFIHPSRFNGARLSAILQRLLTSEDCLVRCRELARRLQDVDPIAQTCDFLEELQGFEKKRTDRAGRTGEPAGFAS